MNQEKIAEVILHRWKMELKGKDKTKASIANNFDELVDNWKSADVSLDAASDLMKDAIKAHLPSKGIIKAVYRRNKLSYMTEDEYAESWCSMIEGEAYQVFYLYYPLEIKKKPVASYGSMSKQEHMRQMSYADTHPDINMEKIIKKRNAIINGDEKLSVIIDLESL